MTIYILADKRKEDQIEVGVIPNKIDMNLVKF